MPFYECLHAHNNSAVPGQFRTRAQVWEKTLRTPVGIDRESLGLA